MKHTAAVRVVFNVLIPQNFGPQGGDVGAQTVQDDRDGDDDRDDVGQHLICQQELVVGDPLRGV